MSLAESLSDNIVVKNLISLLMIDIHTNANLLYEYDSPLTSEGLRKRGIFCEFFTRISSVRRMIICRDTPEVLYCYSKLGRIPKLHNLYHLQVDWFFNSSLQILSAHLETCPNLKNLIVHVWYAFVEPKQINFTNVPRCLILTLENVEIQGLRMSWTKEKIEPTMKDEEAGIKLVNYFLENSAVLKKLTLSPQETMINGRYGRSSVTKQDAERYKKLLTTTKLSPTCEVIIETCS